MLDGYSTAPIERLSDAKREFLVSSGRRTTFTQLSLDYHKRAHTGR